MGVGGAGPVDEDHSGLPDILCVLQVCLEGEISKQSAARTLAAGSQPTGDLIPWTVSQQFQDEEFPTLSGARIVRIAVHPDVVRAGYGSKAVDLLARYYEGQLAGFEEGEQDGPTEAAAAAPKHEVAEASLLQEQLAPRSALPPLLLGLSERPPERLQYLGVSFGLTQPLFSFWKKRCCVPVYVRQTASEVTGEHTCIMIRALETEDVAAIRGEEGTARWLQPFSQDFRRRFCHLLGYNFKSFTPALALSMLDPKMTFSDSESGEGASLDGIMDGPTPLLTPYDLKRMESYANNLVDYHLILDLVPVLARLFFLERIPATLSYGQAAILVSLGLQHQDLSAVETHLRLPSTQLLALFNKSVRNLHHHLNRAAARGMDAKLPKGKEVVFGKHAVSVEEDLEEGAAKAKAELEQTLRPEEMEKFAIAGREADFDDALSRKGGRLPTSGLLSIKSSGEGGKCSNGHGGDESTQAAKKTGREGKVAQQRKKQKRENKD